MVLDEGKNFLFADDRAVVEFGEELFVEKFGVWSGIIDFFEDFGGDLADGHFEVADLVDDDVLSFVFFDTR